MKAYYYLFYKLYKFWEFVSIPRFWSDFKAIVSIVALEVWLLFSIINTYSIVENNKFNIEFSNALILVPFCSIIILNYTVFIHTDKWKEYNAEFDQLSRRKNIIGGIIVWAIILSIIVSVFTSAYLLQKNVLGM